MDLLVIAQEFVELLVTEDSTSAVRRFDDTMRKEVPPERLCGIWRSVVAQVGPFQRQIGTRTERIQGHDSIVVVCQFERGVIDVRIPFDAEGRIAGLFFAPGQTAEFQPPPYADPARFVEREVVVGASEWPLPGTLSVPRNDGPHPVIVLVHGSGPNDRDETLGPNKPFRDLAWGLASRGIAVLRYDKRTKIHAARLDRMWATLTVNEEAVDDAVAAIAGLRGMAGIDSRRIFVLGHSQGGTMAPRIGQRDPGIAGLIIMAGATTPLEDAILAQTTYLASLDGTISPEEEKHLDEIKQQVARVKHPTLSPPVPRTELPLGIPAVYWLDLRGYHPPVVARELNRPLLILQGGRDYQVTPEDFDGWRRELSSCQHVVFTLYPSLNHLFMEGEGMSSPVEYLRSGHVAKVVIEEIAAWVSTLTSS